MEELENFNKIKIGLASDEKIREWSHGEVKKPETINYRTLKPEKDGLFCEKIFGPTKDWECHCGKYKRVRYKGIVCDRCGVEVTKAKVRRERMGHIELAAPVAHIWYFKGIPSRIALLLDISPRELEKVIYFASYIVTDKGTSGLLKNQIINEKEYHEAVEKYGKGSFKAEMGAEAIKKLLAEIDIEKLATLDDCEWARDQLKKLTDSQMDKNSLIYKIMEDEYRKLVSENSKLAEQGQDKADEHLQKMIEELEIPIVEKEGKDTEFQNVLYYRISQKVLDMAEEKGVSLEDAQGDRVIDDIYEDLEKIHLQEKTNEASRQAAENQQQGDEQKPKQPEGKEAPTDDQEK